jgi:ABC-type Mn2+/Zn2+ transport system permease subunit/endonuclease/exonuclease/phosphatase family metal-dependent hydrolase
MLGASLAAVLAALVVSRGSGEGRSHDAAIGILWTVGMAIGVLFISMTPGFAPNLASYLFGDILAVNRNLLGVTALLVGLVLAAVLLFFKELVAVAFDEEYARTQGLPVQRLLTLLMVLIALAVVVLIQVVGAILAIALLTIPPVIGLAVSESFRGVIVIAVIIALVMSVGGLMLSFEWDLPAGPAIVLLGFALLLTVKGALALKSRRRPVAVITLLVIGIGGASVQAAGPSEPITSIRHLEFLGQAVIPAQTHDGVPFGGLSGLAYDAEKDLYYAISDDRAEKGPARFYTLEIDLEGGALAEGGAHVLGWTALTHGDGSAFAAGMIDPEAIALTPSGTLVISSEGRARGLLPPFLREFSLQGRALGELPLGQRYMPRADGQSGVRDNLALESASITPDGRTLFSATENALAQDGPISALGSGSPGRILRYDLENRTLQAEYLYRIGPILEPPARAGGFATAGVVDVLALDEDTLIVLERSFSLGVGNDVRLYEVDLSAATDILPIESLKQRGLEGIVPARKRLLLHCNRLGITPDNLEGMTLGPALEDGSPTLLIVSDNNFNPFNQVNQVLAFALRDHTPPIDAIQGAGHRSPLEGDWVRAVEGVVTAVDLETQGGGFWIQSGADSDDDPATSAGVYVHQPAPTVHRGDRVSVDGAVREIARRGALSVTRLEAGVVEVMESGVELPEPIVIGRGGRRPPTTVIDDDAMSRFEPCCDGLDFFEALEGMRVRVEHAVAVSGTSRFGEIAVLGDRGADASIRSSAGGLILRPGDFNPERILLDDQLVSEAPSVRVGDTFRGPLVGVLDYSFANFKLLVEDFPAVVRRQTFPPRRQAREKPPGQLSVASYNVLNLDPGDGEDKYHQLARSIVSDLGSPDVVGLQEVQDDNGAADEGVVSATRNLGLLTAAIRAGGGPAYEVRQIDPDHNADGGQPNGNIRVTWLANPATVRFIERGAGTRGAAMVSRDSEGKPALSPSPSRIAPQSPAFAGEETRGWNGGRKCLATEALFRKRALFLINCHLKSKSGDDRLFGSRQPPVFSTVPQRTAQAREVRGLVEEILKIDRQARIIVLGDTNEHEFAAPMRELTGAALVNLIERVPRPERYSFNFNGNSQILDHILVSESLAARVVDVRIHHINADLPSATASSDHDPVSARFDLSDRQ